MNNKISVPALLVSVASFVFAPPSSDAANLLGSRTGLELGLQSSSYRYDEPTVQVKLSGEKLGAVGAYTVVEQQVFSKFDLRYAYGQLRYEGSGTKDDVPDTNIEARITFGGDLMLRDVAFIPFSGFGCRYLYNDLRGTTSTGAIGYRRYSTYRYLPVGLTTRILLGTAMIFAPTVEYDVFLSGRQVSKLSDTGLGFSDANNRQKNGYGYRASMMFETGNMVFGPWMHQWKIEDSDLVSIGFGFVGLEPKNRTREYGMEFRYRF
jgi:hypothetical protein